MTIDQDILQKNNLVALKNERFVVKSIYATSENMTSTAVYNDFGINENEAYAHQDTYEAILKLVPILKEKKLKLKIFDAYRPPLAHERLKNIIPIDKFFAATPARSKHCYGIAVDVCLCDEQEQELEYPTNIDGYTKEFANEVKNGNSQNFMEHLKKCRQDYEQASPKALANRQFLREIMEQAGFEIITHEWWHYNLQTEKEYPIINI